MARQAPPTVPLHFNNSIYQAYIGHAPTFSSQSVMKKVSEDKQKKIYKKINQMPS